MLDLVKLSKSPKLDAWRDLFDAAIDELQEIQDVFNRDYSNRVYFPDPENIFKAFEITNPESISVVIFGQDPYVDYINSDREKRATGLAFSSNGTTLPPSLKNIYKVINSDFGCDVVQFRRDNKLPLGDLTIWALQGVLLLNSSLVAVANEKPSRIWLGFLNRVVEYIDNMHSNLVYMLWGSSAITFEHAFKLSGVIIKRTHPSPLSAEKSSREAKSFMSGGQFKECNDALVKLKKQPINWCA